MSYIDRPLKIASLFFCLGFSIWACSSEGGPKQSETASEIGIRRRTSPQRIICAAPSITEFVFALGFGHRVVGVSDFSTFPPEAKGKPQVGGLINPNKEKIVSLEPDLLILQGRNDSLARLCKESGIRFLSIEIDSLEDIWSAVALIGEELKAPDKASALVLRIQEELRSVRERIPPLPPVRVFLSLGHTHGDLTGLMTASSRTFIHELLTLAGGDNIFKDASGLYPQISKESLVKRRPEVIMETIPGGAGDKKQKMLIRDWLQLPMLPAVRSGRIHFLTEDYLLIPGVRIAHIVLRFAQIIHPDVFNESGDARA